MRIIIVDNYSTLSKKSALMIASQIILKPDSVIGFATGDTPLGTYKELISLYNDQTLDFSEITSFNLDEYFGLDPKNPQSYHHYMMNNLFNHINISPQKIYIPSGLAKDIQTECDNYEKTINAFGGIDLQLLGIGRNGHIGFNEPDIKFEARTHIVELDEDTINANSRFFNSKEEVPTQAISMGIKTIMHAKKIVLLASGQEKANAIYNTVYGKITPEVPASVLQLHPDVTLIVDKDAASMFKEIERRSLSV